ncbi:hypothetical protein GCM10017710_26190 [Arthrobacter ramosus]
MTGLRMEWGSSVVRGGKKGVCTMCTLLLSDWAVPGPDWVVLAMFSGVPSVSGAWKPVRVPRRAWHNPPPEGFLL